MVRKWVGIFAVMWLLWGCLKNDETQYYTDIYWFRNEVVVAGIDTSMHQTFDLPISVFRTAGLVYETDSVVFEVLAAQTTAVSPDVYELESNVVRFVNADTTRSEIRMKVHSGGLVQNDTVTLRLLYDHPSSTAALRRHDRIRVVLMPVAPAPEPEPEPEPDAGTETGPDGGTEVEPGTDEGTDTGVEETEPGEGEDAGMDEGSEGETGTDAGTSDTEPETGSETETETDTDAETESGAETDTETVSGGLEAGANIGVAGI